MNKLLGKTALVTGSSRGIGKLVVLALAKEGCRVFVHGRELRSTQTTLDALHLEAGDSNERPFPEPLAFAADLSDPKQVDQLAEKVLAAGGIDILYNNAAIMSKWSENISKQDMVNWAQVLQINTLAPMRLTTLMLDNMKARKWGRIVNVTSGIDKLWQLAAYGASKWALDKWTDDLGRHLEGSGVIVSRMDPGWLRTDLGGPNADHAPETVLPGAMVPVLLGDDAPQAQFFRAQDLREK